MPEPPDGLSAAGVALWNQTLAVRPAAEWNAADAALLEIYVHATLDVRRLDGQIAKHGELVRAGNGTPMVSPLVTLRARREGVLLTVAKRLRLSPCSRYTAKDVGRLARHAGKASAAAQRLDADDLLAGKGNLQ